MPESDSFLQLMTRLRVGEDDAAMTVFRRYVDRLNAVARRHLDNLLKSKVDPEDIVQSVYRSFFQRVREGEYELTSWEGLQGLLARITINKCLNRMAHFRRDKRDATKEASRDQDMLHQVLDPEPTAEEALIYLETVSQLLGALDPTGRQIIELSLQGCTVPEISKQTGWAERTIRRTREHVRKKLESQQLDSER
jgi:RNA polymerase sigma-70 factor (ECF subfamily)